MQRPWLIMGTKNFCWSQLTTRSGQLALAARKCVRYLAVLAKHWLCKAQPVRSPFCEHGEKQGGEWFPPGRILLRWLCGQVVIMVELCLLPWVAEQLLLEKASCFPGILLVLLPFSVCCGETWSFSNCCLVSLGSDVGCSRQLTVSTMWYRWCTVWFQFSSTAQMGKIHREMCLRVGACGVWRGYFLLCKVTFSLYQKSMLPGTVWKKGIWL